MMQADKGFWREKLIEAASGNRRLLDILQNDLVWDIVYGHLVTIDTIDVLTGSIAWKESVSRTIFDNVSLEKIVGVNIFLIISIVTSFINLYKAVSNPNQEKSNEIDYIELDNAGVADVDNATVEYAEETKPISRGRKRP